MPVIQAHVDGNGLQEDMLQPVLDSLSQLFKDSNHKVLSVVWDSNLGSSITFILETAFHPAMQVCQKAIQVLHMVVQKHGIALASYSSWFLPVLVQPSMP